MHIYSKYPLKNKKGFQKMLFKKFQMTPKDVTETKYG